MANLCVKLNPFYVKLDFIQSDVILNLNGEQIIQITINASFIFRFSA